MGLSVVGERIPAADRRGREGARQADLRGRLVMEDLAHYLYAPGLGYGKAAGGVQREVCQGRADLQLNLHEGKRAPRRREAACDNGTRGRGAGLWGNRGARLLVFWELC